MTVQVYLNRLGAKSVFVCNMCTVREIESCTIISIYVLVLCVEYFVLTYYIRRALRQPFVTDRVRSITLDWMLLA